MIESVDNIIIKPFENKYLKILKDRISKDWSPQHVLLKSDDLLLWQYHGYGQMSGMHLPLLFEGDKLIGYRLMTPIEIMLSDGNAKHIVIPSAVSTLYYVDEAYRGMKLGLKLQFYVIEHYGGYFAIASNLKTSAPIHKKSGAKMLDTMYRYVRPLTCGFNDLIVVDSEHKWNYKEPKGCIDPTLITAASLAKAWNAFIQDKNITSLNRSEDFWQWRYLDSPIYKYTYFEDTSGIVVGRVCDLYNEDRQKKGKRVFRILEIIPSNTSVWDGCTDKGLAILVDKVCGWASKQGCCAVEFYMSTSKFGHILKQAFFEEINKDDALASCIMSYFEPCATSHRLSNVSLLSDLVPSNFDFENSYFTLSDADQDRPNIL